MIRAAKVAGQPETELRPSEVVSQSVPRRWLTCDASEDGVGGGHEGEGDGQ